MRSIHVLRKPCSESTVTANVLRHGTGGINVNGSRIAWATESDAVGAAGAGASRAKSKREGRIIESHSIGRESRDGTEAPYQPPAQGRWPANLVLGACIDGELNSVFPHTKSTPMKIKKAGQHGSGSSFSMVHYVDRVVNCPDDEGSAARYFKRVSE